MIVLRYGAVLVGAVCCVSACQIEPSNPWDPETAPALQAQARVVGRVILPSRDLDESPVELVVMKNGRLLEENGVTKTFRTRTEAEGVPDGWRDDGREGAAGSYEVPLEPGTWAVVFSAAQNVEPLYDDAATPNVTLSAGETAYHDLRPEPISEARFQGVVTGVIEGVSPGRSYVVRLVPLTGTMAERTLVRSGDATFQFTGVAPTSYRVRVEGEGYAPAVSPSFQVTDEHSQASPLVVEPLRLVSIGELFEVAFDDTGTEAPYVGDAAVPVRLATAQLFLQSSGDDALHHAEIRALPESVLEGILADEAGDAEVDGRWTTVGATADVVVDLDEGAEGGSAADGSHLILAQLRLCLHEECDCADDAPLSECVPPLYSGIAELRVTLDTEPPALLEAAVAGVAVGASAVSTPTLVVNCARFDDTGCPLAADVDPYAPLFLVQGHDATGRIAGYAVTLDDEAPPSTFTPLLTSPGLASFGGVSPGIAPVDGEHTLRFFARDAAGNVGLLHERPVFVDVTPIELADPALLLAETELYSVDGEDVEIIPGDLVSVDVATVGELPSRWSVRRSDGPLLTGLSASGLSPYDGPVTALVSGLHGDNVSLEVVVEDDAGNASSAAPRVLRLWRTGKVLGSVVVEGGGPPADLAPTLVDARGERLLGDAFGDGTYSFADVLRGVYTLELAATGFVGYQRSGVVVESARDTVLAPVELRLPRGDLVGRFVLDGREGESTNSGISVSLLDGAGAAVAGAVTLADGTYYFDDIPAGTGYSVVGAFEGYVPAEHAGIEVLAGVRTVINPSSGTVPEPVVLRALVGDFRLCAPSGVLDDDCAPLVWTNLDTVEVGGVDLAGIAEYRIATQPFSGDEGWRAVTVDGGGNIVPPSAGLGGAGEGLYMVYLQLRVDETNVGEVLTAEITYDTTPPSSVALVLAKGADALRDGFTNSSTVSATVTADAGTGQVAPLGNAVVRFATAAPASPPATTKCSHGAACAVPLDDLVERTHSAWAFSCDRAGNCSATPVQAKIVYDVTAPRASHGVTLTATSSSLNVVGGVTYTRSAQYDIDVGVGAAKTAGGDSVLDVAEAAVPDVVGYRFGVDDVPASGNGSFGFDGIDFSTFESFLVANATLTARGPSLPGAEGSYRVYAQLKDAAGNSTALDDNPFHFDLVLDTTAPGVTFVLNGGDEYTSATVVDLDTTASAGDPPVLARIATDGGLFETYVERAYPFGLGLDTWDLGATAADGSKAVHVRFYDAAGNVTERSDTIFLDRTAPEALLVSCSSCSLHNGVAYTSSSTRQVVLELLASDNSGFVDLVDVTGLGAPAAYASSLSVTLPVNAEGEQELDVTFTDLAGNVSGATTLPIVLDRVVPVASLSSSPATTVTSTATIQLAIGGSDVTSPVVGMRLSNTGVYAGEILPLASTTSWTLDFPTNPGSKTVYLEVYDAAGNRGATTFGITLDLVDPAGTVSIASGASYSTSATVSTRFQGDGGAGYSYQWREGVLDCSTTSGWSSFDGDETVSVTLSGNGYREVYACFREPSGRTRLASDGITVDTSIPNAPGAVSPDAGAWVATTQPTLRFSAAAGSDYYRVTVINAVNAVVHGPVDVYTTEYTPTSALPAGALRWSVVARDSAGNQSSVDSSFPRAINVDVTAPSGLGGLTVVGGSPTSDATPALQWNAASDALTSATALRYTLEVADGATFSAVLLSAELTNSAAAPTMSYTMQAPLGDGSYAWRVTARDLAGNSQTVTALAFTVDTTAPAAPAFESVASPTTSPVTLQWTSVTGASLYRIRVAQGAGQSGCGSFTPVDTTTATTTYALTAPSTAGCYYTARVSSLDALGNESAAANISVLIDTQAPVAGGSPVVINSSASATRSEVVTLSLSASGATKVRIKDYENNNCTTPPTPTNGELAAATTQSYQSVVTWVLPPNISATNSGPAPTDQCKWIAVSFGDDAGNFTAASTALMDGILLDTLAPDAPQIATASTVVDAASIVVALAQDSLDHHFSSYQVRNSALMSSWTNVSPDNPTCLTTGTLCNFTVTLAANLENRIGVRAIDTAGSTSAEDFVIVREDSTAPSAPATIALDPSDTRIDASWTASTSTDVAGYLLYYGLSDGSCSGTTSEYNGGFAEQGSSPIDVGKNTDFSLTGVPNGVEVCVGVTAYDETASPAAKESTLRYDDVTTWELAPSLIARLDQTKLPIAAADDVGAVVVKNGLLYIAASNNGLIELDVSNEACFTQTGATFVDCAALFEGATTMGGPNDMVVHGGFAFVSDLVDDGVHVWRVAEDTTPVYVLEIPVTNPVAVAAGGNVLAVARSGGFTLFNLDNLYAATPTTPAQYDTLATSNAYDVDIQGTRMVIGAGTSTTLYDISDPANAVPDAVQCATGSNQEGVTLSGKSVYTGHTSDTVEVCDTSTTTAGSYTALASVGAGARWRLEVMGPYLAVTSRAQVTLVNVSVRSEPRIAGVYESGFAGDIRKGSVAVEGYRFFHASGDSSAVDVVGVGRPTALELVATDGSSDGASSAVMDEDSIVLSTSPPQVLHVADDGVDVDDDTGDSGGSKLMREGDRMLGMAGSSYRLLALDKNGSASLLTPQVAITGAQSTAGVLSWPWVLVVADRDDGATRAVYLRSYDARDGSLKSEVQLVASLDEGFGFVTIDGTASIALYKRQVFVLASSLATDTDEGVYRVRLNPQTGVLDNASFVHADPQLRSITRYGRRLYMSDASGLDAQTLRAPATWSAGNVVSLGSFSSPNFGNTATLNGPYIYSPAQTNGTTLVKVSFATSSPWDPTGAALVTSYGSSFAYNVMLAGDRVYVNNYARAMDVLKLR